jgi:oligoendopeptidase F
VAKPLPARSEVDKRYTWNSESVFADLAAFEQAVQTILGQLPDLVEFKGHLGDSPETLRLVRRQ